MPSFVKPPKKDESNPDPGAQPSISFFQKGGTFVLARLEIPLVRARDYPQELLDDLRSFSKQYAWDNLPQELLFNGLTIWADAVNDKNKKVEPCMKGKSAIAMPKILFEAHPPIHWSPIQVGRVDGPCCITPILFASSQRQANPIFSMLL